MVSQSPRVFTTAIAVSVFWIGWVNGSFAATAWGWIALLCSCAVGLAVLAGELRAPRVLLAWGLALSAFVVWAGVSLLWTSDVTTGVQDVQRSLVYVAVAGLAVTFADAATPAGIRNGVLIGSSALCLYGVAAHLLPDVFGVASQASAPGRSFSPLGYWNAQGMLAVLAMILAMGVVSTDGSAFWRARRSRCRTGARRADRSHAVPRRRAGAGIRRRGLACHRPETCADHGLAGGARDRWRNRRMAGEPDDRDGG